MFLHHCPLYSFSMACRKGLLLRKLAPNISKRACLFPSFLPNLYPKITPLNPSFLEILRRSFCTSNIGAEFQGPAAIDYRSLLDEDEYHRLADSTIHDLLEKLEEYGDSVQIDGFDIDYGNQVLTLKLGPLGTYVLNKQTPNRQLWLSSPVSGPSRFDWDRKLEAWVYRRTKANLSKLLETELGQLCGSPVDLS